MKIIKFKSNCDIKRSESTSRSEYERYETLWCVWYLQKINLLRCTSFNRLTIWTFACCDQSQTGFWRESVLGLAGYVKGITRSAFALGLLYVVCVCCVCVWAQAFACCALCGTTGDDGIACDAVATFAGIPNYPSSTSQDDHKRNAAEIEYWIVIVERRYCN